MRCRVTAGLVPAIHVFSPPLLPLLAGRRLVSRVRPATIGPKRTSGQQHPRNAGSRNATECDSPRNPVNYKMRLTRSATWCSWAAWPVMWSKAVPLAFSPASIGTFRPSPMRRRAAAFSSTSLRDGSTVTRASSRPKAPPSRLAIRPTHRRRAISSSPSPGLRPGVAHSQRGSHLRTAKCSVSH